MNAIMYANLSAEIESLEKLLADIPEYDVIDRMGLENRLADIKAKLGTTNPYHLTKKAKLTFRGSPVIKSEAISATFAAKATKLFSEAVSACCVGLSLPLNFNGPIPNSQVNQLMITGTAVGSFGFEFELPQSDTSDLCPITSDTEKAIDTIRALFFTLANGSDDDLSDLIEEVQPRAVKKIHNFLKFILDQDARCGLEFDSKFFRFSTNAQIENSIQRLDDENIHEIVIKEEGSFRGSLPNTRSFEFNKFDQNGIIKGRISKDIINPEAISIEYLFKPVIAKFTVITIGNSKPKYILKSLEDINFIKS